MLPKNHQRDKELPPHPLSLSQTENFHHPPLILRFSQPFFVFGQLSPHFYSIFYTYLIYIFFKSLLIISHLYIY